MRLVESKNLDNSFCGHNAIFYISIMNKDLDIFNINKEYPLYLTSGYLPIFGQSFIIGKFYITIKKIDEVPYANNMTHHNYEALCFIREDVFCKDYSDVIRTVKHFVKEETISCANNFFNDVITNNYYYPIYFRPYDFIMKYAGCENEDAFEMQDGVFIW